MDKSTLESQVELRRLKEKLNDPEFDRAIEQIEYLISRPQDITVKRVAGMITELAAISAKFGLMSTYYKSWGKLGTDERYKKDLYYTARDGIKDMVDSLKYLQRALEGRFN